MLTLQRFAENVQRNIAQPRALNLPLILYTAKGQSPGHAFGVDDIAPGNNPAGPARLPARMMMCLQPHLPFPTLFPTVATLSEHTWSSFR